MLYCSIIEMCTGALAARRPRSAAANTPEGCGTRPRGARVALAVVGVVGLDAFELVGFAGVGSVLVPDPPPQAVRQSARPSEPASARNITRIKLLSGNVKCALDDARVAPLHHGAREKRGRRRRSTSVGASHQPASARLSSSTRRLLRESASVRVIRVFGLDIVLRTVERYVAFVARANVADFTQIVVIPSNILRDVGIGDRFRHFV